MIRSQVTKEKSPMPFSAPLPKELEKIIDAHGGLEYWAGLRSLDVEMSADGFLFKAKHVRPLDHVRMTINTVRPEVVMHEYPVAGQITRFLGNELVEVLDNSGRVLQSRRNPREMFVGLRRILYWDLLDFAYFSGYAIWNYMTMPFLFLQEGVEVSIADSSGADGLQKLSVRFPKGFPTHCELQDFYFDCSSHLIRHDYTAEVVGSWAHAAHLSGEYGRFGGLSMPTGRRVYPKLLGHRPLPFPVLVAIDVHDVVPYIP